MNVFKEMVCSVVKLDAYPGFLKNKKGKIFGYGMLLLTFYFLLSAFIPLLSLQIKSGGIGHVINDVLPDFEVSKEGFWMEEPFYLDEGGTYIDLDSDYYFDEDAAYDFARDYNTMLLIDAEKLIVKNEGQIQTFYFSSLDSSSVYNKESILAMVPMIYGGIVVCLIFYYIWIAALFFFGVLIVSLVGMILSSILKTKLTFGQIYILALYGRTLSLFIKGIVRLAGVSVPFFWVINFGITLIYMFFAMKKVVEQRGPEPQNVYYVNTGSDAYYQDPGRYPNQNDYSNPAGDDRQDPFEKF